MNNKNLKVIFLYYIHYFITVNVTRYPQMISLEGLADFNAFVWCQGYV